MSFNRTLFAVIFLGLAACTRPQSDSPLAKIKISTKLQKASALSEALPEGKKACYGVHVKGPSIAMSRAGSCSPEMGIVAGFVEDGGTIEAYVPKGPNRTFELYVYLADPSEACPTLNLPFTASTESIKKTYLSGSTTGVTLNSDQENVSIDFNFPGEASPVSVTNPVTCDGGGSLKASLYSNGDVLDSAGNLLATQSFAINESFFQTPIADPLNLGQITSGGVLNIWSAGPHAIPPFIFSVTRKPDSGIVYGLLHSGKVVEITPNGDNTSYVELSASNCPFELANCEVPVWMQSISAGFGTQLFALDHGGQVYRMTSSGPLATSVSVSPAVTQISYY